MREILFRGKEIKTNLWKYGYYEEATVTDLDKKGNITLVKESWIKDGFGMCWVVDKKTVGEFTGMTDTNDNKIFEGDICRYKTVNGFDFDTKFEEVECGFNYETEKIDFRDGEFTPRPQREDCDDGWHSWGRFDFKVIGNIHDRGVSNDKA